MRRERWWLPLAAVVWGHPTVAMPCGPRPGFQERIQESGERAQEFLRERLAQGLDEGTLGAGSAFAAMCIIESWRPDDGFVGTRG